MGRASRRGGTPWLPRPRGFQRRTRLALLYGFLILVSLPVMVPYFWLGTLAFSARLEDVNMDVLWPSIFILVPAVMLTWVWSILARTRRQAFVGWGLIWILAAVIFAVGPRAQPAHSTTSGSCSTRTSMHQPTTT